MTKFTEQQIADLYSAAVSAEVNDEADDAASASSFEFFDQLEATGGAAHTIRVLIDRVRAAERAMNPTTAADDIAWWKQEAEDCKALLLERAKENGDLRRQLDEANLPVGKDAEKFVLTMPADLHPDSKQLVLDTAGAMAAKLLKAQVKYGFDNGWKVPPASASGDDGRHFWSREDCLSAFFHHLGKGDPLDCINYLAFMRANGWDTQLPTDYLHLKNVSELYDSVQRKLFALAQRVKPAFDTHSDSCSDAISELEQHIFGGTGENDAAVRSALGEGSWNKLQELVSEPAAPTEGLKALMSRAPKSELLQRAEKLAEDTAALAIRVTADGELPPELKRYSIVVNEKGHWQYGENRKGNIVLFDELCSLLGLDIE